jgi:hypothetical protein
MKRQDMGMRHVWRIVSVFSLLGLSLGIAACSNLNSLDAFIPAAPSPPPLPPFISDLQLSPKTILANRSTTISFTFVYKDVNGDIGPDTAKVILQYESSDPHLYIPTPRIIVLGDVSWTSPHGTAGAVKFERTLSVEGMISTVIRVKVRLRDTYGNDSNELTAELSIRARE